MTEPSAHRSPTPFLEVLAADRAIGRLLHRVFRGIELTPTDYGVYSAILDLDRCTVTDLAARLSVPLTTASDWVQGAIGKGHLTRERSLDDGRRYALALTERGRAAFEEAAMAFHAAYVAYLRHASVPDDDVSRAISLLREAVDAATAELADDD